MISDHALTRSTWAHNRCNTSRWCAKGFNKRSEIPLPHLWMSRQAHPTPIFVWCH